MASGARRRNGRWREIAGFLLAAVLVLPGWSTCEASAELTYARLCRKAVNVQGRTYALKRMGYVLVCADKFLKCELVAESGSSDAASCRAAVASSCSRR